MNGRCMMQMGVFAGAVLMVGLSYGFADERLVTLPVVVKPLDGANGTRWESRIRIIRTSEEPVRVRRVWVVLPEGGFVDDPQTAPTWGVGVGSTDEIVLTLGGGELMEGVTSPDIGAVQLAVEGSAHILERIADTAGTIPNIICGSVLRGPGQIVPAFPDPMSGPSFIPWANQWGVFRNNVGIVNPNEGPMSFTISAVSLIDGRLSEVAPPMEVSLPSYGFIQLNRVLAGLDWQDHSIECVFVITIEPEDDRPYYAYGSMVYSGRNDPHFVAPVSGTVAGLP